MVFESQIMFFWKGIFAIEIDREYVYIFPSQWRVIIQMHTIANSKGVSVIVPVQEEEADAQYRIILNAH